MSREWTADQLNAINARGSNILVSAAAGSGKTAVLVERVIRYITDDKAPIDVDKLLVVTFTNAAAAEMKNRIFASLSDIIRKNPNDTNAIRQMSLLPSAKICTIDSFCINLVRENFFNLDISQDFAILDEAEDMLLKNTVANNIIDMMYEQDDGSFRSLVELLSSSKNDSRIAATICRIYGFIMAQPFPIDWLRGVADTYNPDVRIEDTPLFDYITTRVKWYCDSALSIIHSTVTELAQDEMYDKYYSMLLADKALFDTVKAAADSSWDELKKTLDGLAFVTMPSKRGYDGLSKTLVKANRDRYKDIYSKTICELVAVTSDEYAEDCRYLHPIVCTLIDAIAQFHTELMQRKMEINRYSFSDIQHFAIDLLFTLDKDGNICRTPLCEEYRNNFAEILVDEYQDTNTSQDTLFAALSNGHNRFMVGDIKQSIYRFRLAMPQIFNGKKDSYTIYDEHSDSLNRKIYLDRNFRSRSGICHYANLLFSNLMSKDIGEIDYDTNEYLYPGAEYPDAPTPSAQIKIVNSVGADDAVEYEAQQVASMIIKKITSGELVKGEDGGLRPIRYSDIAVLFRSPRSCSPVFRRVFADAGIPVVSENRVNLFENNEVSILLSLLRVIDNPVQDIPLLATLTSVFYGYSCDDIAAARVRHPAGNLYSAIAENHDFERFRNDIEKYRVCASSMSVESLIRRILSDSSYLSVISAMGNGKQRRLNVMRLLEMARSFDNGDNVGLTAFMRYIDSIISSGLNIESAAMNGGDNDCVSFMSVHKSKGLEYPVVILACSTHKYNYDDLRGEVQLNEESGIGIKVLNEVDMYRYNSQQYIAIKHRNAIASISENLRVLYVAVTRAKEQFITFVSYSDPQRSIGKLGDNIIEGAIPPCVVQKFNCDADMILTVAMLHKDGGLLRNACDKRIEPDYSYDFDMDIEMISDDVPSIATDEKVKSIDATLVADIANRLAYRYERGALAGYAAKRAASSLDEREQSYKYIASSKPAFMSKGGLTPAERGTAMHTFMQFCDYRMASDSIEDEIKRLVSEHHLTGDQAESLDRASLTRFFKSDLAARMFAGDRIYREINVSSFVDVSRLEDTDIDERVLVQGISDCVFCENGELVLVDYKTDRVSSEDELLDRYKNQISFYRDSVAKVLHMPVKEALLYSFYLGKACKYK